MPAELQAELSRVIIEICEVLNVKAISPGQYAQLLGILNRDNKENTK